MSNENPAVPPQTIEEAAADPRNLGEMPDADTVGTAGGSDCGDMLRMWIKFTTDEKGRRVIDRASFQSFGCQTAVAVASVATQLLKGRTPQEALALGGEGLAAPLGPLPPMKIHCAQLVEDALRDALSRAGERRAAPVDQSGDQTKPGGGKTAASCDAPPGSETLMGSLTAGAEQQPGRVKIRFLTP